MTFQLQNYRFTTTWIPTLVVFIIFPLLLSLGFWQLDRAEQKRHIEQSVHDASKKEPLIITNQIGSLLLNQIYRNAKILGHYDNQHQFLYDNMTHKGRAGYHVLTPFLLQGQSKVVLINRGWIPYLQHRLDIPDIQINEQTTTILGRIQRPKRSINLKKITISNKATYPRIIQSMNPKLLQQSLNYKLLPIIIELDPTQNTGFIRDWQPFYGTVDKHIAYAVQWFGMAGLLLLLYIFTNTKKIKP